MEHDDKPLPIPIRTLGQHSTRCHAFAKALHYKEVTSALERGLRRPVRGSRAGADSLGRSVCVRLCVFFWGGDVRNASRPSFIKRRCHPPASSRPSSPSITSCSSQTLPWAF